MLVVKSHFSSQHYNQFAAISTSLWDYFRKHFSRKMSSLNRKDKVTCGKCGTQTTRPVLARHKKGVQLEHFFVLIVSIFQHVRKLTSTFILQKDIVYPSQRMFKSLKFVRKLLLVSFTCDYTNGTPKMYQLSKMWIRHSDFLALCIKTARSLETPNQRGNHSVGIGAENDNSST